MSLRSYLGTAKAAVIEVVASLDAAVIAAVIVVASLVSLGQITGDTGIYWAAITRDAWGSCDCNWFSRLTNTGRKWRFLVPCVAWKVW